MAEDSLIPLAPEFGSMFVRDMNRGPCQIYLISPLDVTGVFPDRLTAVLDAVSIAAFQFRVKDVDQHEAARLAQPLLEICQTRDVAFIVNDDISLAKRIGADGVHLGQGDGDPRDARSALGPNAQIGVTCHDSRHLAMEAGEAGADYIAFGAYFPTTTKEVKHIAGPELLSWWTTLSEIPCVAIGGITADNCDTLVHAGADFLAVSGAVWNHPDGAVAGAQALSVAIRTAETAAG